MIRRFSSADHCFNKVQSSIKMPPEDADEIPDQMRLEEFMMSGYNTIVIKMETAAQW